MSRSARTRQRPTTEPIPGEAPGDPAAVTPLDGQDLLAVLMEHVPDVIFVKDAQSRFLRINRASANLWGLADPEWAIGKSDFDLAPPDVAARFVADDLSVLATGAPVIDRLEPATDHDGAPRWLLTSKVPIRNRDGDVAGLLGIARDVTARVAAEEALRESEQRFRAAFESAAIGMALVAPDGRFLRVNRALLGIVGYAEQDLLGRTFQEITHPDDIDADLEFARQLLSGSIDSYRMEKRYLRPDGAVVWVQLAVSLVYDAQGEPLHFVAQMHDVTARKALEERLRHLAFHDPLTDLPNRAFLLEHLQHSLARMESGAGVAVLFLDLDRFKVVNDSLGHAAGDELLRQVVERLTTSLRPGDSLARFGGDEFTIVLRAIASPGQAQAVADRLLRALAEPFVIEGREAFIGASIGITVRSESCNDAGELLREADVALYRAKNGGRGRSAIFDPETHADELRVLTREAELRRAIDRNEFALHYQPIIELASNEITGFEALLRWQHPDDGLLLPADFLPLAEETGLIVPIGKWVMVEACRRARFWRERYPGRSVGVAINVSPREFRDPDFGPLLWRTLAEENLPPSLLTMEVTENALGEDADATTAFLRTLKGVGVKLALDDFGTGYSSLGRIHQLPLDSIKIDRSFIAGLETESHDRAIVRAVAGLAGDLGLTLTASGVETAGQVRVLREFGCASGQGYHFSPPVPAPAAETLLNEDRRPRLRTVAI